MIDLADRSDSGEPGIIQKVAPATRLSLPKQLEFLRANNTPITASDPSGLCSAH